MGNFWGSVPEKKALCHYSRKGEEMPEKIRKKYGKETQPRMKKRKNFLAIRRLIDYNIQNVTNGRLWP